LGAIAVLIEMSEKFEVNDKCNIEELIKYVGMALSAILLVAFSIITVTNKHVWDMFHSIRMHVCITWLAGLGLHICTDLNSIRDDGHMNLYIGLAMIYFYTSAVTWVVCEAHANFKALTGGIISGRGKVYMPFGYGTPVAPLGILFLFFSDELGTDPRCFISYDVTTKSIFFYYVGVVTLIGVILALILAFNIAKPQTKRMNVVADLKSQAKGSILVCFAFCFFWIFGYFTYMRNAESETPDFYCYFIVALAWFGAIFIFIGYAIMSTRFRKGIRGEKAVRAKYAIQEDAASTTQERSPSISRSPLFYIHLRSTNIIVVFYFADLRVLYL
jgi:hypothetical protein